jgi:hypothetical protein
MLEPFIEILKPLLVPVQLPSVLLKLLCHMFLLLIVIVLTLSVMLLSVLLLTLLCVMLLLLPSVLLKLPKMIGLLFAAAERAFAERDRHAAVRHLAAA